MANAQGQTSWTVDPKASLAWWQMSPNFSQLWATTCPLEPSWRPGEGASPEWANPAPRRATGYANVPDTVHVPLYPRDEVRSVCGEAVEGRVVLPDTVGWRDARGQVTVRADALIMGANQRDTYARTAVLETRRYPYIRFTLDSLVDVTRHADTLRGTAVGVVSIHGVDKPLSAAVRAWPQTGGTRVVAKLRVPAQSLVEEFRMSGTALSLGVGTKLWKDFFMGVDLLLRPEATGAN